MRYWQPLCYKSIWQHNLETLHMRMVIILSAARFGRSCSNDSRSSMRQSKLIAGGYLEPDYGACYPSYRDTAACFEDW
jgi:hypothetical protein